MAGTRLGVLGGTFNPIHNGHLQIAQHVQKLFSLSKVHFVLATVPPHKSAERLLSLTHRYAMLCLATQDDSDFIPSLVELEPPASAFSVDTMEKLSGRMGAASGLFFIAGTDSLLEVASWHQSEKLLSLYNFVFVVRPGVDPVDPTTTLPEVARGRVMDLRGRDPISTRAAIENKSMSRGGIFLVDTDAPDISASGIRASLAVGEQVAHLLPGPVDDYIRKLHLYGEQ